MSFKKDSCMYKQLVSRLFTTHKSDNEIYHDLMQFKVREILLVATIYDAFILEQEGKLTELIFGEYHQLNLSTAPRVTAVAFGEEALASLDEHKFDMIILTMRIDEMTPFELGDRIREKDSSIPVLLLLNDDNDLALISGKEPRLKCFDRVFIWNGDAKVLLAMIKYIEDKINVVNDTRIGLVRVILLVEDSIHYFSRYLPILHTEIMRQTQRLIADENLVEMKKLLRMRTRPKVLMAENWEEAVEIFDKYQDYLLCVISDVKFMKEGVLDENAGVNLIRHFQSKLEFLPVLLQSSDPDNSRKATELGAAFLDKNTDDLSRDLTDFINLNLGFGDFIFRDKSGRQIDTARSMSGFRRLLKTIPDESLVYHSNRNHFSSWLMARGEIQIAKFIQPMTVSDFETFGDLRKHLIEVCNIAHRQRTRGRIVLYDDTVQIEEEGVVRLTDGSIGGKGRGMVFLNMLVENKDLFSFNPGINVSIPQTAIIGTEEYDHFIETNGFRNKFADLSDYEEIKKLAAGGELSDQLRDKLRLMLESIDYPLAVRSSSLFEDSISQPFSGIYETYFLPNNHPDIEVKLQRLEEAIKLVYASVYSAAARSYLEAINYKIGEEKMAVLIQRVAGSHHENRFYPHISGVAQSYNYYPVSYLKPEDGIAVIAMGLGQYVVDGEKAWRFCPNHPGIDFIAQEDFVRESQTHFYTIDMDENSAGILEGGGDNLLSQNIEVAGKDGTSEYCVSVWDAQDRSIKVGNMYKGPKIVNFASILKYDYIPLAKTVEAIIEIVKSSMGMPVQIEFAVDLNEGAGEKPTFYILQIKPLVCDLRDYDLDLDAVDHDDLVLFSNKAMGNGTIDDIRDIIYVDTSRFDKSRTVEMAAELEKINRKMRESDRKYILIGPGRWGSRDRWLGIPVRWPDISNARIIVEAELEDFHFDASLGSHFFHNVTSQGVGYFSIPFKKGRNMIDWAWLKNQPVEERTENYIHIRMETPLLAKMDGRKSTAVIYKPS